MTRNLLLAFLVCLLPCSTMADQAQGPQWPLPLPRTLALDEYEALLYRFLQDGTYDDRPGHLNWKRDKRIRDTGPYVKGVYRGTHPAVRVYYSPEVYQWLKGGRQGTIPDGAMIVKEMYPPPAVQYANITEEEQSKKLSMWTFIVKDSKGSKDGWFWGYYGTGQAPDSDRYPFDYPNAGFGQYCIRCHASADRETTFASLQNIEGEPGEPITYEIDDSWIKPEKPQLSSHAGQASKVDPSVRNAPSITEYVNQDFLNFFREIALVSPQEVVPVPSLTYDHVPSGQQGPPQFITSDQCLPCHDGNVGPFGSNMFAPADEGSDGVNLSPYGEWNWSMMGLSGRDPIFYAQLESELAIHNQKTLPEEIQHLCFHCHGVMGQRQLVLDHPERKFQKDFTTLINRSDPNFVYGALARDGVSCMVCHQIVRDDKPLDEIFTGNFEISHPGQFESGRSQVYGPFRDPKTYPMLTALGIKPANNEYIKSSRLCGGCHTVFLPIYNAEGEKVGEDFEQATYLEWLNSAYQNEMGTGEDPKTCQDCHMPGQYGGNRLKFKIANIQDQTFPESDHVVDRKEITIDPRDGFARHTLLGLNQFALEMFRQFDHILGVRKTDYMTGSENGLPFAIQQSDSLAREETARVEILKARVSRNKLTAQVKVTNLTGHRFPSGVGFRRAFLEFKVEDAAGRKLWASGTTNSLGIIVDDNGNPLPSEFQETDPKTGEQAYQPHYDLITRQNEVQIYQEMVKNPEGKFSTSFLNLIDTVKDNRLLPRGWKPAGPDGFKPAYAAATSPRGNVLQDKQFLDGSGSDVITYAAELPPFKGKISVTASLYYQSIPPSYLRERFSTATASAGRRLHYLASHLDLSGTNIESWKLLVQEARREADRN